MDRSSANTRGMYSRTILRSRLKKTNAKISGTFKGELFYYTKIIPLCSAFSERS